jgi:hypothetical protein
MSPRVLIHFLQVSTGLVWIGADSSDILCQQPINGNDFENSRASIKPVPEAAYQISNPEIAE